MFLVSKDKHVRYELLFLVSILNTHITLPIVSLKKKTPSDMFRSIFPRGWRRCLVTKEDRHHPALINFPAKQDRRSPLWVVQYPCLGTFSVSTYMCIIFGPERHICATYRGATLKSPWTIISRNSSRDYTHGWHVSVYKFIKIKLLFIALLPPAVPRLQTSELHFAGGAFLLCCDHCLLSNSLLWRALFRLFCVLSHNSSMR